MTIDELRAWLRSRGATRTDWNDLTGRLAAYFPSTVTPEKLDAIGGSIHGEVVQSTRPPLQVHLLWEHPEDVNILQGPVGYPGFEKLTAEQCRNLLRHLFVLMIRLRSEDPRARQIAAQMDNYFPDGPLLGG